MLKCVPRYIQVVGEFLMQTRKLKQLLEQLEEVMAELKLEVYSDVDKYRDEDGYYNEDE
jgi:hypothetical protein